MVARRVPVDGPRPSVARARPETGTGRAPDRRRARPSGTAQAPAARREARSLAPGDQGRRAAYAAPIGGRAIPLRDRPRQVPCGTPDGRSGAEEARRGTGRGTLLTGAGHGLQTRDRGAFGPRPLAREAGGPGGARRGHGGARGESPPSEMGRRMDRGTPEGGGRQRPSPPGTSVASSESSVDAPADGARGRRWFDGASARDGHVCRNRPRTEFDRGPGHRSSPLDVI